MIVKYVIIIILVLFFIFCFPKEKIEGFSNNIPKIIWAYWDSEDLPPFIKICQKNWRKFAPNYKINLLNKKDVNKYVNMPSYWKELPAYRQADILRLLLLEKYGGVWMDASILLLTNLDNIIGGNLTLFTTPNSDLENPVYENWFIASTRGNRVIGMWIEEVLKALGDSRKYIMESGEEDKRIVRNVNYLICHLALRNIYVKNKGIFKGGKYLDSNSTAFWEHNKYKWKNVGKNAFKDFTINSERLMIKLRKRDREGVKIDDIPKILY